MNTKTPNALAKERVSLVSVSFLGRDLNLGVVALKSYAMKDPRVADRYSITISQFFIDTLEETILSNLIKENSTLYCFSTQVWNIDKILGAARKLKEALPKTKILLGGPQAGGMSEKILLKNDFVDYVIVGDGEIAFRELLLSDDLTKVPNLSYRKEGSIVTNHIKSLENLDELPMPYESEDYRKYLDDSPKPVRSAIETSRGCTFNCGYCSWGSRRMNYFSLEKIKPAFEFLLNHPKVSTVYITDSNPFLKKERAVELLSFLIEKNVHKKPITFELNPEYMNDEGLLALITKLNNEEFAFGVQSTSKKVLEKIVRQFDAARYKQNILLMKNLNPAIRMWFSLIIGLPGDNYHQFLESLNFILGLEPEGIYIHELLCLPGSSFYANPKKYGLEFTEEPPHKLIRNETFTKEEYNRAKRLSYNVHLFYKIPAIKDGMYELHKGGIKLSTCYEQFVAYLDGKLDTLSGKSIEEVSSWFFEQYAAKFLEDSQNIQSLQSLYSSFRDSIAMNPQSSEVEVSAEHTVASNIDN